MHLLNLTLQAASSVTAAAVGNFSGTKGQEIIVVRGSTRLEILKYSTSLETLESICSAEVSYLAEQTDLLKRETSRTS